MQEFEVSAEETMSLSLLRRKHAELGLKWRCIVRFAPKLYLQAVGIPGFIYVDECRVTKPIDPLEIGGVEVFHLVPSAPIEYAMTDIC